MTRASKLTIPCLAAILGLLVATAALAQTSPEEDRWKEVDRLRTDEVADDPEKGILWRPDLETAMKDAQASGKPVIIFFSVRELGNPDAVRC